MKRNKQKQQYASIEKMPGVGYTDVFCGYGMGMGIEIQSPR